MKLLGLKSCFLANGASLLISRHALPAFGNVLELSLLGPQCSVWIRERVSRDKQTRVGTRTRQAYLLPAGLPLCETRLLCFILCPLRCLLCVCLCPFLSLHHRHRLRRHHHGLPLLAGPPSPEGPQLQPFSPALSLLDSTFWVL